MTATVVGILVLFWSGFALGAACYRHESVRLRRELRRERENAAMRARLLSPHGPVLYGLTGGRS